MHITVGGCINKVTNGNPGITVAKGVNRGGIRISIACNRSRLRPQFVSPKVLLVIGVELDNSFSQP